MEELIIVNGELTKEVSAKIAEFERMIKSLKEQEEALKKHILDEMEKNAILSLDTPDIKISYVSATNREVFDSKAFRADFEELYNEYVKISPVSASLRIKVK